MRNLKSAWRGIRAMTPNHGKVNFNVVKQDKRYRGVWAHWWTPVWHDGRGPYISIGLWFIAIYRGY